MIEQKQLEASIAKAAADVRANNPLAGSITNTVTIDFVANAQLAVGGSAAMVYLPDEGETLVAAGGAVYLNMGTLFPIYEETIPRTAAAAQAAGKPWVLDPVGIGIGSLRTKLLSELKQHKPAIVRGNASEIIALAGLWGLEGTADDLSRARGVDTADTVEAARAAAIALARYTEGAVVISGESDLVTDGHRLFAGRRACRIRYANRSVHGRCCRGEPLQSGGCRGCSRRRCSGKLQGGLHRRAVPCNPRGGCRQLHRDPGGIAS